VDCGYHRAGVDPEGPLLPELAQRIGERTSLRFAGILTHAGHSYHAPNVAGVQVVAATERDVMRGAAARLAAAGITVPVVSVGSTPTITHVDHLEGVHEVRAGNYAFYDVTQVALGSCRLEDCVLSVLAAVVQCDRSRSRVIIDAGAIALSKDRGPVELDAAAGYGRVLSLEGEDLGLRVAGVSQEHGSIPVHEPALLDRLAVGSRVRILVNHSCLTAAQHAEYVVHEGTTIVDRWVNHRGW
jgi:D-serine deaminase-like pyridoxal phosphate-dependent protein